VAGATSQPSRVAGRNDRCGSVGTGVTAGGVDGGRVVVGCDDEAGEFGGDVSQFGEGLLADGDDVVFALGGFLAADDPANCRCEVVVGVGESVAGRLRPRLGCGWS